MVASGFYDSLIERGMLREEDREPEIDPYSFYMDAFRELSSCRINSFGPGQIPFTAIVEYARLFEVEDFPDFHFLIRLMDNVFLDLENKRRKAEMSKGAPKK
jgi:hypothetical protein